MRAPIQELKASKEDLLYRFSEGSLSQGFQQEYTSLMDAYFLGSIQESPVGRILFKSSHPFAVVAVGGYGRRELSIHSDVDVMILFPSKVPQQAKALADEILLPLWDLGLDLGYAIRTIADALSLSSIHFEVLTSIMDSRFVCGDSPTFLALMENVQQKILAKKGNAFFRWLQNRDKMRRETFGDASSLLEPQLKEGVGGLRDYHHMLWLGKQRP